MRELSTALKADHSQALRAFSRAPGADLLWDGEEAVQSSSTPYGKPISANLRKQIEERAVDDISDEDIDMDVDDSTAELEEGVAEALRLENR